MTLGMVSSGLAPVGHLVCESLCGAALWVSHGAREVLVRCEIQRNEGAWRHLRIVAVWFRTWAFPWPMVPP